MINFFYETDFKLPDESALQNWIYDTITFESYVLNEINYIFCDDEYLHNINIQYLNHDTYTDIITFDNTVNKSILSDIFISIDRVRENALTYNVDFTNELKRVIIHGVLHLCGYNDKTDSDATLMRNKEDFYINRF